MIIIPAMLSAPRADNTCQSIPALLRVLTLSLPKAPMMSSEWLSFWSPNVTWLLAAPLPFLPLPFLPPFP